jgi:hypothetical protein
MQSRGQSHLEVGIDFVLSVGVNIVAQVLVYGALATAGRSIAFAAMVLGLAIPRRYTTRRLFNALLVSGQRQTRWQSWVEVAVDTMLGLLVAILLQWVVYGAAATWAKAGGLTVLVYALTLGRRYLLRRLFVMWNVRQERQATYGRQWSPETSR